MIITLDNLAHRYQCLPSEALGRATTFDLYVLDISTKWSNYHYEKMESERTGKPLAKKLSEKTMLQMIESVKGSKS